MTPSKDVFLSHFEQLEKQSSGGAAWMLPTRKAAFARFAEEGFPTTRDEDWRYTNVAPIANTSFTRACNVASSVTATQIESYLFSKDCVLLVCVNGRFDQNLSTLGELPKGVIACCLSDAVRTHGALIETHMARYALTEQAPFAALNTAMMDDGLFLHIETDISVSVPIHVLYLTDANAEPVSTHPRNLIIAGPSSQVSVVETYGTVGGGGSHFTNVTTEIIADDNAHVSHYRVQCESDDTYHVSTLQIHQQRDSQVQTFTMSQGSALVRNNIATVLDGPGADCSLTGLYIVDGKQHVDNHLTVDHAKPHCTSREFFKGVLQDEGKGIFRGRIIVRKDAQKTDAVQTNRSLLLSDRAMVESKPQLEILADDVKCTHGATIGQVNEDELFYLQTRGVNKQTARNLLVFAFANECLSDVRIEPLRKHLSQRLLTRLPHGEMLGD